MRTELTGLPHGWFHHGELVLELIEQLRPQTIVELGTWRGASAIAMARLARTWGGVVYCVDTWMGEVNGGVESGPPAMLGEVGRNIVAAGVASSIRLIPALTVDAAAWWTGPIDFLWIDADHTYDAVRADLEAWVPHVRIGGLFAGDDYGHTLYPGVAQAWDRWADERGQALSRVPSPQSGLPDMALVYGWQS